MFVPKPVIKVSVTPVSRADADVHRRFVEEQLAPGFREAFTMEAHLGQLGVGVSL